MSTFFTPWETARLMVDSKGFWTSRATDLAIEHATEEILGQQVLRRQKQKPFFLPLFTNPLNRNRPVTMNWLRS